MSTALSVGDIPWSATWSLGEMGPLELCVWEGPAPPLLFTPCMTRVSVSWCKERGSCPHLPTRVVENFQTKEVKAQYLKSVTNGP